MGRSTHDANLASLQPDLDLSHFAIASLFRWIQVAWSGSGAETDEAREIRTRNLLIWSQTRYRCAIAPIFEACRDHARLQRGGEPSIHDQLAATIFFSGWYLPYDIEVITDSKILSVHILHQRSLSEPAMHIMKTHG